MSVSALLVMALAACTAARDPAPARAPAKLLPLATSAPCSPKPCAVVDGLEIVVSGLERDAPRPSGGLEAPSNSHYVRLRVSFTDLSGEHTVLDPRSFTPSLIDEEGPDSTTSGAPGASLSYQLAHPDNFCGAAPPSIGSGGGNVAPPLAKLKPGERFGPLQLCFWVRGKIDQRLVFAWVPFNWPDTPGVLYRPVEIPL
jgi:hypothetical protein